MMDGAWNAKQLVTEYLAQDIPSRIIRYRNYWELDDHLLPTPRMWLSHEPLQLDHWPTVITLVTGTQRVQRDDYDYLTGDPRYEVEYSMRTYIWVKQDGADFTTMSRDRLTAVIRDALIDHPSLRSVPRWEHCEPYVDEGTIREEFSDLTLIKGERFLAGSFVAYDLKITESVTREPLSDVPLLSTSVTVEQIPKTANAPAYVIATAGDTEVGLAWKAPTWDGGVDPIDSYRIEQSSDGGETWAVAIGDTGSLDPNYTVTGLTNGTEYCFRVSAINSFGVGAASPASNAVTPTA